MQAWREKPAIKKVVAVGSVFGVVAGLIGTIGNLERVPEYVCRVPGIHALCGRMGVGRVASDAELAAWQTAQQSEGPGPLREYLEAWPEGVYVDAARQRLAACRAVPREQWVPERRTLPLFVTAGSETSGTLATAHEVALRRGTADAAAACAGFAGEFRLTKSAPLVREWTCRERAGETSCAFDGFAVCDLEARQLLHEEVCR